MKVVIHPGFAKCGSTSLQSAVYKDAKRLAQRGISLFGFQNSYDDEGPDAKELNYKINEHLYAESKRPKLRQETAKRIVSLLGEEIDKATQRKSNALFITNEDLIQRVTEIATYLPAAIPIDVFVMVRNPRSVFASHFNQELKNGVRYKSGTEYVNKIRKEKKLHFNRFLREVEQCSRISRLVVARVDDESQDPLEMLYRQCFGVRIAPPKFPKENQAVSEEALSVIQCTVNHYVFPSIPIHRNSLKKPTHRFFQLLHALRGPEYEDWTQYEIWDQRLNSASRAFTKTVADYELSGAEMSREHRGKRIPVDEFLLKLNHIPRTALRGLLSAALTVGFELHNRNERDWLPDFADEIAIMNSQYHTRAKSQHKVSAGFSLRDVLEILSLLGTPSLGAASSPTAKSCSYRLIEIILQRVKSRGLINQESSCRMFATNLDDQMYHLLYQSIVQLWWEIFNESEREWLVEWTSAEISFIREPCHVILTRHSTVSGEMND